MHLASRISHAKRKKAGILHFLQRTNASHHHHPRKKRQENILEKHSVVELMNCVCLAAMTLLVSSIRFSLGWTANPSIGRRSLASVKPRQIAVTTQLPSFNQFRWSEDELKGLQGTYRSYNSTTDLNANDQRDLISFEKILSEPLGNSTDLKTFNGAVEKKFGPNQHIPVPPLDSDEIANVLGIEPEDVEIVLKNQCGLEDKPPVLSVSEMFRNSHFVGETANFHGVILCFSL